MTNGDKKPLRVLVSPLDWGLGHATRCIPLIRELGAQGCQVVLACNGGPATLLGAEFPGIEIRALDGYNIRYGKGSSTVGSILLQLPGILKTIKKERYWLEQLLLQEHFDLVISDNRPGFWSKKVKSVYITHQLRILSGRGNWLNNRLQKIHTAYMKNFDEVWVPDLDASVNLAGELSHPPKSILPVKYLGLLARFEQQHLATDHDLLVLLSGPEPQRTLIEEKLYKSAVSFSGKVVFVRGLPKETVAALPSYSHITVHNHLPAHQLQQAIASAKFVICRSGYTTLMELVRLQKKAVLVPTPGQPEQEYLAVYLQQQSFFPYLKQKEFDLQKAVQLASSFPYRWPFSDADFIQYKAVIAQTLTGFNR